MDFNKLEKLLAEDGWTVRQNQISGDYLTLDYECLSLWMANLPLFDFKIYRPREIKIPLFKRIPIYLKARKKFKELVAKDKLKL